MYPYEAKIVEVKIFLSYLLLDFVYGPHPSIVIFSILQIPWELFTN